MPENALGKADGSNDATDKELSCDFCGDTFSTGITKRRHERNYHAEELDHECPDCGEVFHTRRSLNNHHAQKHDGSITGYDRECPICGDQFTTSKKDMTYCSPECGSKSQRNRITLECEWCETEFETTPSQSEGKRFCSLDCKTDWFSDYFTGENHPHYDPDNHVETSCKQCGDSFETTRNELESDDGSGSYCSQDCLDAWRRENWVGENNPLYKGGDTYYGENWHQQRRRAIKRDQHRCQDCGATPIDLPREPSVHHIIPLRDFDKPENANTLDNLITLCETCHAKWEGLYLRPDNRGE